MKSVPPRVKRYSVKVIPRAKHAKLVVIDERTLKVWLRSPPVDGKANEELIGVLAAHFKVKVQAIRVVSGITGRQKWVELSES